MINPLISPPDPLYLIMEKVSDNGMEEEGERWKRWKRDRAWG